MNGPGSLFASESFPGISSHPRNDFGNFFGSATTKPPSSVTPRHPLEGTHELRQACQICFVKSGQDKYKAGDSVELVTWEFLEICNICGKHQLLWLFQSLFAFFLKKPQLLIWGLWNLIKSLLLLDIILFKESNGIKYLILKAYWDIYETVYVLNICWRTWLFSNRQKLDKNIRLVYDAMFIEIKVLSVGFLSLLLN